MHRGVVWIVVGVVASHVVASAAFAKSPPAVAAAAANECVVKVQLQHPQCLHCLFEARKLLAEATGSIHLDLLTTRYPVETIEPLFRREGRSPLSLRGLDIDRAVIDSIATHSLRLSRGIGAEQVGELPSFSQVYRIRFAEGIDARQACQAFAEDPSVVYAHPNYLVYASELHETVVRAEAGQQLLEASLGPSNAAAPLLRSDRPVVVAIVDTGMADPSAPSAGDLRGWDMTTCETFDEASRCVARKTRDPDPLDTHGQGSRIAELIQTVVTRAAGHVAAQPPVIILPVQVMNGQGRGVLSDAVAGLLYAIVQGADVVYLGFSTRQPVADAALLGDAIQLANTLGVLVVTPAGDGGVPVGDARGGVLPAALDDVLAVAALDGEGRLLPTSNYGIGVELTAPGFSLLGTPLPTPARHIRVASGSSMAAAYVAAAAALRLAVSPSWHLDEVRSALRASAGQAHNDPFDARTGYGMLRFSPLLLQERAIGVSLVNPSHGTTISGWVDMAAKIRGPAGLTYHLSVGRGDDPTTWQTLSTATTAQPEEVVVVGEWMTTEVPDGIYTIRLAVTGANGAIYEDRRVVLIDN